MAIVVLLHIAIMMIIFIHLGVLLQVLEAKLTRLAQLYKELQVDMQAEREQAEQERRMLQKTHSQHIEMLRRQRRDEVRSACALCCVCLPAPFATARHFCQALFLYCACFAVSTAF